jgi:type I restriction enzyme S subunit
VNIRSIKQNTGIQNLDEKQYFSEPVALPSNEEQQDIADFLDRETAKIDALVEKKARLIGLLQEKRTALITHAVTKGLDPDVPMKDSGIEWLGQIPAHWEMRRLKDRGTLMAGAGFPHEYQGVEGEALGFYKVGDLAESEDARYMSLAAHTVSYRTAAELRARVIPIGAVVYAKIGAALLLNRRRITTLPCCIDNNMTAYVPSAAHQSSEWAFYWTSILDFGEVANPGAVPSLSEGDQGTLALALPPLTEQQTITDFLDRETARIDALTVKVREAIERLKEYRTALVSAAVTGKIDVRDL